MENHEEQALERMVLAPYIQKSTALRGKYRYVGGNQFRHALATFAILLDYHYMDPVLLKASIIHDIFEDVKCVSPEEIITIDQDGQAVYDLVMEVTRQKGESKEDYLDRILNTGTQKAKIIKCADRISNLIDLHTDTFEKGYIRKYIDETKMWVLPMAQDVNPDMHYELKDLIKRRDSELRFHRPIWPLTRTD